MKKTFAKLWDRWESFWWDYAGPVVWIGLLVLAFAVIYGTIVGALDASQPVVCVPMDSIRVIEIVP